MTVYWTLLSVIACERIAELVVSARHANALLRRGGVEYGFGHFPVVIALHGATGEDGSLRGVLDLCAIPYVGCDARASRLAWDKLPGGEMYPFKACDGIMATAAAVTKLLATIAVSLFGGLACLPREMVRSANLRPLIWPS